MKVIRFVVKNQVHSSRMRYDDLFNNTCIPLKNYLEEFVKVPLPMLQYRLSDPQHSCTKNNSMIKNMISYFGIFHHNITMEDFDIPQSCNPSGASIPSWFDAYCFTL